MQRGLVGMMVSDIETTDFNAKPKGGLSIKVFILFQVVALASEEGYLHNQQSRDTWTLPAMDTYLYSPTSRRFA